MDENKSKALQAALSQIEKQFGKNTVMRLGDQPTENIQAVSTGSLGLDIALGIGGLPKGRIIEIYGPESSGKTTLTLHAIANAQKAGGICAFIDAEHAFDAEYAKKRGGGVGTVSLDELLEMPNGDQFEPVDERTSYATPSDIRIDTARAIEKLPERLKHLVHGLTHHSMAELSRNGAVGRSQLYVDLARLKRRVAPLATYLH